MFYVVMFVYDTYCGIVGIMNVNKGYFGSGMWIMLTLCETIFNAVLFTY
jgi:hypothetical protein